MLLYAWHIFPAFADKTTRENRGGGSFRPATGMYFQVFPVVLDP